MNRRGIRFFVIVFNTTLCIVSYSQELEKGAKDVDLSKKVVRMVLDQNQPADVKVGLQGITTLQFPAKIEAIDGYGFSVQPKPDTDQFQLCYNKGTNFFSLKALRPGARANLTVVINEKVYCIFCQEHSDPSFVVIFGAPGESGSEAQLSALGKKVVSPAQLLGFLDKVKRYPALLTAAPESVASLSVNEPNKSGALGEIQTVIKRVVRDDSIDSVGFEVQLNNRSQTDFYFDPEGFAVRAGDAKYDQTISDAGGMVPAGKSVTAFFAVVGTANDGRNNLAVNHDFDLEIRTVDAAQNLGGTPAFIEPPADHWPTAATARKEREYGKRNRYPAGSGDSEANQKSDSASQFQGTRQKSARGVLASRSSGLRI